MRKRNNYTKQQRSLGGLNKPRREERFEEIQQRFLDGRKGHVIAEGTTYTSKGQTGFKITHSKKHANSFDIIQGGATIKTANSRSLPTKWIRKRAKTAAKTNVTYQQIT